MKHDLWFNLQNISFIFVIVDIFDFDLPFWSYDCFDW